MADFQSREEIAKTTQAAKQIGELTYKLSLDISEALAGLKALQREAKEATKALRELEAQKCEK